MSKEFYLVLFSLPIGDYHMSTTTIRISGGQTFTIPQVMTAAEVINTYPTLNLGGMTCTQSTGSEGSVTYDFAPQAGRKGNNV